MHHERNLEEIHIDIGPAKADEAHAIRSLISAAYAKYVARIGKSPAPMSADLDAAIAAGSVHVLRIDDRPVGAVVLLDAGDALDVDSLTVSPFIQGRGHGRALMNHAERIARDRGLAAITLHTNEAMHENIVLYRGWGFTEMRRGVGDGYCRVYFRKLVRA